MEGNRDEAERCIEIAVVAWREAKFDKAEKFLRKAETLYPTQKAKDLLDKILATAKENVTDEASEGPTQRKRKPSASPSRGAAAQPQPSEPEYTEEQVELVKKVKK